MKGSNISENDDDVEKNIIKYFLLNNELENVVVLDKERALSRIREKLKHDDLEK